MTHISSLTLTAFRNYDSASIDGLDNHFVILIGENGAGKTNCLEGVSLLSPGRGLRSASIPDMQSQSTQTTWAVSAQLTDMYGDTTRLGVGRDPQKPTNKIIRANGNSVKNQSDLGDVLRTLWLTPQMDGLFLQASSERRRFFDRLVASFDGAHTGRMTRYEKAMRERLNLLKKAEEKNTDADPTWLSALENIMAETSVSIAAARIELLGNLQQAININHYNDFPPAHIQLTGDIETALQTKSALNVEDMARDKFVKMRNADGQTGRTNFGIQRTDMTATYTGKNADAAQCSTGEQKALLTTIILAHAKMMTARHGQSPILLFDEITAHFDAHRRDALFEILSDMHSQIWLSGQDEKSFAQITTKQIITIENNQFSPL